MELSNSEEHQVCTARGMCVCVCVDWQEHHTALWLGSPLF